MRKIATRKAKKGKRSVTLDVFDCENILTYANPENNYYKIVRVNNFQEALCLFYEWVLNMNLIKIDTKLFAKN